MDNQSMWSTYDPNVMKIIEQLTGSIELTRDIMEIVHLAFLETILKKGAVSIPGLGNIHLKVTPKDSPRAKTNILTLFYSDFGSITDSLTLAGLGVTHDLSRVLTKEVLDGFDSYNKKFLEDLPDDLVKLKDDIDILKKLFADKVGTLKYDASKIPIEVLLEVAEYAFDNELQEALQLLDRQIREFYKGTAIRWCYRQDNFVYSAKVRCDTFEDYRKFILAIHQPEQKDNIVKTTMTLNEEFSRKHGFKLFTHKDIRDKIQLDKNRSVQSDS